MSPYRPTTIRASFAACIALSMFASAFVSSAGAQSPAAEPIYWRQNLFLIPYQWTAANEAAAGQAVVLYASKDRGATWQSVSEAKPQVRAFNYRAEADGEYWFAIRTLDGRGNALPGGPMQPELRVIVDTTIPRFEQLAGAQRADGMLEVRWRVVDANFDPRTCNVEVQVDREGNWQPVPFGSASPVTGVTWEAQAAMQLPAGSAATAVRVTAFDLARNRAVYQTNVTAAPAAIATDGAWPAIINGRGDAPIGAPAAPNAGPPGWVSNSALANSIASAPVAAASQTWSADRTADSVTDATPTYVAPPVAAAEIAAESEAAAIADDEDVMPQPRADDRPLGDVPVDRSQPFRPLEPFRQASVTRAANADNAILPIAGSPPRNRDFSWLGMESEFLPVDAVPKLVNSRTFALEYALEQSGHEGVARVELWGTRDGGKSWRVYAADDDNRSPLVVTVDGEGLYGFRMVVESATGRGGFAPQPGDRPELWVGVDMHRPDVTLADAEPGIGSTAGKLVLRWEADDDNLVSRPIALFYSSRPTGPWTAIATNLVNSGQYSWQLERFVPPRVFLRLEARDTAGNVAAYQTSEPIVIELGESVARVSGVEAVQTRPAWPPLPPVPR